MKCPFKKQVTLKNKCGYEVQSKDEVAKIVTDFGDCDTRGCAAWNSYKGKCMKVWGNNE